MTLRVQHVKLRSTPACFFSRTASKQICKAREIPSSGMVTQTDAGIHLNVAVIGAGAAGLVATRELRRAGHSVTAFEQSSEIGGLWVYSDDVETDDLLGTSESRSRIHGSMYSSLRTNLPRHVMAFTDFPFQLRSTGLDTRLYPGHEEVLRYLQQFDKKFDISRDVRLNVEVIDVLPIDRGSVRNGAAKAKSHSGSNRETWLLKLRDLNNKKTEEQTFDAVVVCNGHYSVPRAPKIEGEAAYPGRLMHTHNYRDNSSFHGQRVVIMGAAPSGQDINLDIAKVADKVFFSARPLRFGKLRIDWENSDAGTGERHNIYKRHVIASLGQDGSVTFADGTKEENIDSVLFATGYQFNFPFLDKSGVISVQDNRVEPLYQHVFCRPLSSLSFIGLPWQIIPFPLMELQSKWVAAVLSGSSKLPARQEMEEHTTEFYRRRQEEGIPQRYSHRLGEEQWEYNAWLANQVGPQAPRLESWRSNMYQAGFGNIFSRPDSYRDSFPDADIIRIAEEAAHDSKAVTEH